METGGHRRVATEAKRFAALDGLRGVCALAVVLFHLRITGSIAEIPFFRHSDKFVEFFFVLSGFVIAHSVLSKGKLRLPAFVSARLFRIAPLHLATLLAFVALEVILLALHAKGISVGRAPFSGNTALSELVPNALMIQSWSSAFTSQSFNTPSWSISVEFAMYLAFAALALLPAALRTYAWGTLVVLGVASIAWGLPVLTPELTRGVLCFFSGCLVYLLHNRLAPFVENRAPLLTVVETLCVGALVVLLSATEPQLFLVVPLFCVMVFTFAFEKGVVSRALLTGTVRLTGRLSFSIYMTHYLIIRVLTFGLLALEVVTGRAFTSWATGERLLSVGGPVQANLLVVAVVSIVLAVSYLSHRFIELKGQAVGKRVSKSFAP